VPGSERPYLVLLELLLDADHGAEVDGLGGLLLLILLLLVATRRRLAVSCGRRCVLRLRAGGGDVDLGAGDGLHRRRHRGTALAWRQIDSQERVVRAGSGGRMSAHPAGGESQGRWGRKGRKEDEERRAQIPRAHQKESAHDTRGGEGRGRADTQRPQADSDKGERTAAQGRADAGRRGGMVWIRRSAMTGAGGEEDKETLILPRGPQAT
jgi:hypothetical protein